MGFISGCMASFYNQKKKSDKLKLECETAIKQFGVDQDRFAKSKKTLTQCIFPIDPEYSLVQRREFMKTKASVYKEFNDRFKDIEDKIAENHLTIVKELGNVLVAIKGLEKD